MTTTVPDTIDERTTLLDTKTGSIFFWIDGERTWLPLPKIGQLKGLRAKHHEINDRVSECSHRHQLAVDEFQDKLEDHQARLKELNDLDGLDDAELRTRRREVRDSTRTLNEELRKITAASAREAQDVSMQGAVEWFRFAVATLAPDVVLPDDDDLPGWMMKLGTVREWLEHWMTHPSRPGV